MIDVVKDKCVGCFACKNKCPQKCISLKPNKDGFLFPIIDYKKCVSCNACETVCPVLNAINKEDFSPLAYAVKNVDVKERLKSSSGGVWPILAKSVLSEGGVIFGAVFGDGFKVKHDYTQNIDDIARFQGSKYVQSEIGDCYFTAEKFLKEGRRVLFSGTPCQIAGLKNYLGKNYDNLLSVDIACFGVPSPLIFEKYLSYISEKYDAKPIKINFRDKTHGWENYFFSIDFADGKSFSENHDDNEMMQAFLSKYCLRDACYDCKFKGTNRFSDITLCDFWGVKESYPYAYDGEGVSLVFVNDVKGEKALEDIKKYADCTAVDLKVATKNNPYMNRSVNRPIEREIFINQVKCKRFDVALKNTSKKAVRATKIKIYKEDIERIKKEQGVFRATLYALKHFIKAYL